MPAKLFIPPLNDIAIFGINKEHSLTPDHYQIFMVLQGGLNITGETFDSNLSIRDILILNPGKNYHITPTQDNLILRMVLDKSFIQEHLGSSCQIYCNSSDEPQKDYSRFRHLLSAIASTYYDNAEENRLTVYAQFFQMVALIQKNYVVSTINLNGAPENTRHLKRIQDIISYIDENYNTAITLTSLAENLYLSPQYLSKFIKHNFHKTFYDYLNQVRIEHALSEIQYTNTSITKIAFNNGFPNLTAFNKLFKELYHTTPSNYRRDFKKSLEIPSQASKPPQVSDTVSIENFESAKAYFSDFTKNEDLEKSEENAVETNHFAIHANTLEYTNLSPTFIGMVNAGFAINMLSSNFQEQLLDTFEATGFKYFRLLDILDDEILPEVDDPSVYNFSSVDMIMDFLYEHEKYPFLELSSKPRKTTIVTTSTGFLVNPSLSQYFPERNYHKLDRLIRHCINRYGQEYVNQWYFEVWAAHTDYLQFVETPEDYAIRYSRIYEVLSKHLPQPKLGGLGFNSNGAIDMLSAFLHAVTQTQAPLTFISLYLYPYRMANSGTPDTQNLSEYIFMSPDKDILVQKIDFLREHIQKHFRTPPKIFVTEYNSDLIGKNHINDSCFQAAFICKTFLDLKDKIELMGYWLLGDISEEYAVFTSTKDGGIGLINEHGQKKPAFFAYEFLSQLGKWVLCQGENYIVTRSDENTYRILAFNYAHVSKYYCLNHIDKVNVEDTYSIFETVPPMAMEFNLYNLVPGQYKIKRHTLNRNHGSFLDQVSRMWFQGNLSFERLNYNMRNLSPKELDYFSRTCIPEQSIFYRQSDGSLTLNCKISAHEVLLFEISQEL